MQKSALFAHVGDQLLEEMLSQCHLECWPKKQSTPCEAVTDRFHIVVSGRMRIEQINEDTGRAVTLFLLAPGDVFDLLQLLTNKPSGGLFVAVDELSLLTMPITQARDWISKHPEFNLSFLPYLGQQMRILSGLAEDLALYDTETKLAHLIMRHLDHQKDGQFHIRLINDLSHEVLASMIGSVRAVVNRQLQHWRKRGLINLKRGQIEINHLENLLERSGEYRLPPPHRAEK